MWSQLKAIHKVVSSSQPTTATSMNADVWSIIARSSDFATASSIRLVQKGIEKDLLLEILAEERLRDQHLVDFATRNTGSLCRDEMRSIIAPNATAWTTCIYLFSDNLSSYFAIDAGATNGDPSAFMDKPPLFDKTTPFMHKSSPLMPSFVASLESIVFDAPLKMCERVLVASLDGDTRLHIYRIATHYRLWSAVMAAVDRLSRRRKERHAPLK